MRIRHVWCTLAVVVLPSFLSAQQPEPDRHVDFSGVLFANFQYRTDQNAPDENRFDVERAYLTARAGITDRLSVRLTTDIFQQSSSANAAFYRGWVVRAKYAYLQYDFLRARNAGGVGALARLGLVHTVVIEQIESVWPRWLGITAEERAGYFSSADAGVAVQLSLPDKLGEVYGTITNGPGYTARESDRFKDYAGRVTLTPFAARGPEPLRGLMLTAWTYQGALASQFVNGGPGQVGPVGSSLRRDRWGAFAAFRTERVSGLLSYSQRSDEGELGANTLGSPRVVIDSTGRLLSAVALVRPAPKASALSPLRLVGRVDHFRPARGADADVRFLVAGLIWDLAKPVSVSLDYQEQLPRDGAGATTSKTWFLHAVAAF